MKKPYLILTALLSASFFASGQDKPLTIDIRSGKNNVIYINYDGGAKELTYFVSPSNPDANKSVSSEPNHINIYSKWLNPIRYKLTWADELADDPTDIKIKEFFSLFTSPFGISLGSQKSEGNANLKSTPTPTPKKGAINLNIPPGFNSGDLNMLYVQLKAHQDGIGSGITALNELTDSLVKLDEKNIFLFKQTVKDEFLKLYKASNSADAESTLQFAQDEVKKLPTEMGSVTSLINTVAFLLKRTHIDDPLLNSTLHATVSKYIEERQEKITEAKGLIEKIDPILISYAKSLEKKAKNPEADGFYREKSISFADGKILKSKLTIKEIKVDEKTMELASENDVYSKDFVFQRFESVKFFMSSGVFYSRTSLPGYGVADNNNGVQTVVQDDIVAKQAVAAVFGNFMFDIFNSRYFVPTIQLGVDPTKKRPFLLGGGGITVPALKFSITMGAVWTWAPSLKTLKVGGPVESTLALEKDIVYEFDPGPKGFYLGLQYNF